MRRPRGHPVSLNKVKKKSLSAEGGVIHEAVWSLSTKDQDDFLASCHAYGIEFKVEELVSCELKKDEELQFVREETLAAEAEGYKLTVRGWIKSATHANPQVVLLSDSHLEPGDYNGKLKQNPHSPHVHWVPLREKLKMTKFTRTVTASRTPEPRSYQLTIEAKTQLDAHEYEEMLAEARRSTYELVAAVKEAQDHPQSSQRTLAVALEEAAAHFQDLRSILLYENPLLSTTFPTRLYLSKTNHGPSFSQSPFNKTSRGFDPDGLLRELEQCHNDLNGEGLTFLDLLGLLSFLADTCFYHLGVIKD